MLCAGITKVCGYGIDLYRYHRGMDHSLILKRIARATQGTDLGDILSYICREYDPNKELYGRSIENAALVCIDYQTSIAALLVKADKCSCLMGVGRGFGSVLHLPEYPWDKQFVNKSDAAAEIALFLRDYRNAQYSTKDVMTMLDFIEDAGDISEVYNE